MGGNLSRLLDEVFPFSAAQWYCLYAKETVQDVLLETMLLFVRLVS